MTCVMDKDEIETRIKALKATALFDGDESTDGTWILLYINAKAKRNLATAVPFLELLGISEDAMVHHFGQRWHKLFTKHNCGFINRKFYDCPLISVQTCVDEIESNVPEWENIITRGSKEAKTIHDHVTKTVLETSNAKGDGTSSNARTKTGDKDATDIEENVVTADVFNGKLVQDIFKYLHVSDMKRSVACVNRKWRRAVLDAIPSPEDYLASLHENHIPTTIEILGQQKEKQIGLNHIFTLVHQNTSIHNAIRDVRHNEFSQSAEQNVVDAPTVANCVRHLHIALDEIENTNEKITVAMQSLARRIILMAHQQQNDEAETEEAGEGQPRRPRRKNIVPLKYTDNANKVRTFHVQIRAMSRSCNSTSSARAKQEYVRRITAVVEDDVTNRLGVNDTVENRLKVFQQLAKNNDLVLLDSSKMKFTFSECFSLLTKANLSINQLCTVAQFIRLMRPDLKGLLWPNQLKKGLCDLIGEGNLKFIVKQLPLIVSKSEDKWAIRAFWCLLRRSIRVI